MSTCDGKIIYIYIQYDKYIYIYISDYLLRLNFISYDGQWACQKYSLREREREVTAMDGPYTDRIHHQLLVGYDIYLWSEGFMDFKIKK